MAKIWPLLVLYLIPLGTYCSIADLKTETVLKFREKIKDVNLNGTKYTSDIHLKRWIDYYRNDLEKASQVFRKHLKWREENGIDELLNWTPSKFVKRHYHYEILGKTEAGNPVLYWPVGEWDLDKGINRGHREAGQKHVLRMFEETLRAMEGPEVSQFLFLIDFEKLQMRQVINLRVISTTIDLAKILEENYPVVAYRAMIFRAPPIFAIIYNILKPFLSAPTLEVVDIYGSHQEEAWSTDVAKLIPKKVFESIPAKGSKNSESSEEQGDDYDERRSAVEIVDDTTQYPTTSIPINDFYDEFESTSTTMPQKLVYGSNDDDLLTLKSIFNLTKMTNYTLARPTCPDKIIMLWSYKILEGNENEQLKDGGNETAGGGKFKIFFESPAEPLFTFREEPIENFSKGFLACDKNETYIFEFDNREGTEDIGPLQFQLDWMKSSGHPNWRNI